jgi:type II secretory pathway component PulJ
MNTTPSNGSSRFVLGEGSPLKRAESSLTVTINELKAQMNAMEQRLEKMNAMEQRLERLDNHFRRVVEREVVTSVYTALGFDGATSRHVFYQRLLDNPTWTTNVFKRRTDVAETDLPRILTTLDPRDKSGVIHIGNSVVHSHTIGEAKDFVQNGAVELLLNFIDGGDPLETLESAGYRVQTELAYALPQMDEPLATGREDTFHDALSTDQRILIQQVVDTQMQEFMKSWMERMNESPGREREA